MFGVQTILSTLVLAAIPAPQEATLLFITTPGCAVCQQMVPMVREIAEMGYSVETVDASQHADLIRDQLKVQSFPTFIMVSNDRPIDRVVGGGNPLTLKPRIMYMFERAAEFAKKSGDTTSIAANAAANTASTRIQTSASEINTGNADNIVPNIVPGVAPDSLPNHSNHPNSTEKTIEELSPWITSSVKLRVDDSKGHSWGTGTIIDTRKGEALILTCGHIFRDSQGKGNIEVHLFGQNSSVRVFGRCLHYDLEIDLALVAIVPPCPVRAIPIASSQYPILPNQRVLSVGCDAGANPSIREHYVMSTDRIGTPQSNAIPFRYIQVHGAPVGGRSGGGLFTEDGYLIGVCNTADPVQDDGQFVPPQMIRYVLHQMQLSDVYENPSLVDHSLTVPPVTAAAPVIAPVTAAPPVTTAAAQSFVPPLIQAVASAPVANQISSPASPSKASLEPLQTASASTQSVPADSLDATQRATLDEIKRRQQDGDEVILLVRSRRNPDHPYDMILLNGKSEQFIDALAKQEPTPNFQSYNPVILSSQEMPNSHSQPASSVQPTPHRQPVSFPVLH